METKTNKRDILKDWANSFTNLSIYSQSKLLKINGCIVVGVWIAKLPGADSYRPTFQCYPLWRINAKSCLEEPMFMFELRDSRNLQFTIPYSRHNEFLNEAIKCSKEQYKIIETNDVINNDFKDVMDERFSDKRAKFSPVSQAKLFETKLMGALYVNDMKIVKKVFKEIRNTSKTWRPDLFEWKYGKVEGWIAGLEQKVNNRDDFINQIEINKNDKKLSKLKQFELLP